MYGSWAMGTVLYGEVIDKYFLNATFLNATTGIEVRTNCITVMNFLFANYFEIAGVLLLMSVMTVVLGTFLGFHLYIASYNITTNEYFKWRAVRKFHKKETRKYHQALKDGTVRNIPKENDLTRLPEQILLDVDVGCSGPVGEGTLWESHNENGFFNPGPLQKNIYK
jgi:hypothetical protein